MTPRCNTLSSLSNW